MSSMHCSPYWSPQSLAAVPYNQKTNHPGILKGWEVKNCTPLSEKINLVGLIAGETVDTIVKIAKQTIELAPSEKKGKPFAVNPEKSLEVIIQNFTQALSINYKNRVEEVSTIIKNYMHKQRGNGALVGLDQTNQVLTTNAFIFNYSMKRKEIEDWQKKTYLNTLFHAYKCFKINSLGEFIFNAEDLSFLSEKSKKIKSQNISCFAYVFLKKQECSVVADILAGHDAARSAKEIIELGYRSVVHPNAGDLVLYFDQSEVVQHIGLYTEEGVVESKWGINNPEIFHHSLFDVPFNYGKQVIFMRKSPFLNQMSQH
jgi:hypothetical protein